MDGKVIMRIGTKKRVLYCQKKEILDELSSILPTNIAGRVVGDELLEFAQE